MKLIIAFALIFFVSHIQAQEILNPEVIARFSKSDLEKLLKPNEKKQLDDLKKNEAKAKKSEDKAKKAFANAKKSEVKAKKKEKFAKKAEKNYNDGVGFLIDASNIYEQNAKIRFDVYSKYLNEAKTKSLDKNLLLGEKYVDSAVFIYDDSKAFRSKIKSAKDKEEINESMNLSDRLEKQSLDVLLASYGVFNTTQAIEIKKKEVKVEIEEVPVDDTNNGNNNEPKPEVNVIFMVQLIALQTAPLEVDKLKEMFKIDGHVYRAEENGYFKYRIGRFSTYEEAMIYRDGLNIKDAFIVAYIDGVQVSLGDALNALEGH